MTYLITFACYGRRLHGSEEGSVDRQHSVFGSRTLGIDQSRAAEESGTMDQPPYEMDRVRRDLVLAALRQRCVERTWDLLAAHVRSTHVHVVVEAEARPERVMNDLKAFASRALNRAGVDAAGRKRWALHGSTRWLWSRTSVTDAVRYAVDGQGAAMAVFVGSRT